MLAAVTCPDIQDLECLLLGQITGPEGEKLAQHLEVCGRCLAAVQGLRAEDTFVEDARAQGTGVTPADSDVVRALIERLRGLRPELAGTGREATAVTIPPEASAAGCGPSRSTSGARSGGARPPCPSRPVPR